MNPFARKNPLPAGTVGERHFATLAAAKESAVNRGVASYVIVQAGGEFAWISPIGAFMARSFAALAAGIHVVELGQK